MVQKKNEMQKFRKIGFRRNTHNKDGSFNKNSANMWQAHVWNRTSAKSVGSKISSKEAQSFETIVKNCKDELDEEETALLLIRLIECGLVVVEETAPYETDLYDDGVKFWKKE